MIDCTLVSLLVARKLIFLSSMFCLLCSFWWRRFAALRVSRTVHEIYEIYERRNRG